VYVALLQLYLNSYYNNRILLKLYRFASAFMLFVTEDLSSVYMTEWKSHIPLSCSAWMNVRYCVYRTDGRRRYDNIKIRNTFICDVKLFVQLWWRERGGNCEVNLFANLCWSILAINCLLCEIIWKFLLKFLNSKLHVILNLFILLCAIKLSTRYL
jgi:hypothetical protein